MTGKFRTIVRGDGEDLVFKRQKLLAGGIGDHCSGSNGYLLQDAEAGSSLDHLNYLSSFWGSLYADILPA